ncbi:MULTISPECIES: hypothetical protein [Vibrio]|jgi:hypothetical protein|uniref:Uncharacterized protein n=1 Tax=Vibrio rotiferianus TaxID=190895 RepID=A0A2K7SVW6_9VIBR|nr:MULTISPECIES: hypothetical protein [Vibrio]ASI96372.1 hypothetical protein BSZ04_15535 [Vibrio rotiferianus]MDK9778040.1 hypothetical protein [Vibrio sp. D401a]MDK9801453.1 hypothetical protein [Vibrio sp. D406a]NOH49100.1 hypothetical protein [Vibrio rotiferianus]OHY93818.1 hypothetical protein BI375_18395 [Vibrio rotiferianus]
MNNVKDLASFGLFAAISGFSFGAIFFGIAFVYSAINKQQDVSMLALASIVLGVIGLFVGVTQSNKKRDLIKA